MDSFIQFFIPLTIFLFLFMAVFLLFVKRGKQNANQFIGLFFLCMGLDVLDISLKVAGTYTRYPHYAFWLAGLPFLYGPLLHFYTKSFVYQRVDIKKMEWLHFAPYLICFLIFFFSYHIHDLAYKINYLQNSSTRSKLISKVVGVIIFASMILYLLFSIRLLSKHKKFLEESYSETQNLSLGWLKYILYGFLGILLLSIIAQILSYTLSDETYLFQFLVVILIAMFCFITISVFKGLQDNRIFVGIVDQNDDRNQLSTEELEEQQELKELILKEIETQKLFLNPELKVSDLATVFNKPVRMVSSTINQRIGVSFFDFVNGKRINFIKEQMTNCTDSKKTISEFMYEGGFNSKSSFNTAFKKHAGTTPSAFLKSTKKLHSSELK